MKWWQIFSIRYEEDHASFALLGGRGSSLCINDEIREIRGGIQGAKNGVRVDDFQISLMGRWPRGWMSCLKDWAGSRQ